MFLTVISRQYIIFAYRSLRTRPLSYLYFEGVGIPISNSFRAIDILLICCIFILNMSFTTSAASGSTTRICLSSFDFTYPNGAGPPMNSPFNCFNLSADADFFDKSLAYIEFITFFIGTDISSGAASLSTLSFTAINLIPSNGNTFSM